MNHEFLQPTDFAPPEQQILWQRLHARIASAIPMGNEKLAREVLDRLIDNVEAFTRAGLVAYQ
jgi:DNA-binding FadR family transcriptional regulator